MPKNGIVQQVVKEALARLDFARVQARMKKAKWGWSPDHMSGKSQTPSIKRLKTFIRSQIEHVVSTGSGFSSFGAGFTVSYFGNKVTVTFEHNDVRVAQVVVRVKQPPTKKPATRRKQR